MRIHHDQRGQTIILVALCLPIMLGFVGLATDVGSLLKDKRTIQTAADAAAIAGALNLNYGNYVKAARAASADNGFNADTDATVTITVNDPPTWASSNYNGLNNYVEATVSKSESTIFLALFGRPSVTVLARAVATNQAKGSGCLYTVGTTGTGYTKNGNIDIIAPACGMVVESSDPSAMILHGSSGIMNLAFIGVVGGISKSGNPTFPTGQPIAGIAPESDPLNYLPQFSFASSGGKNPTNTVSCASGYTCTNSPISVPTNCASNATGKKGALLYNVPAGSTLFPGCYSNLTFPSSGTVTMNAGLYIVDGDVTFDSGTINGTGGVTFYTNGSFSFGSGDYNLTAPNDSTQLFNGVLFAESIGDTNGIVFGGNASTVIKGVVYTPDAPFDMHGTPGITLYADFVVHDIVLSGTPNFTTYAALSGVSDPLDSIALVE